MSPERYFALAFVALLTGASISLGGCGTGESGGREEDWSGSVDAEVDDLTGERTGVFRTYGPTRLLIAGQDSIPVTAGYWCEVNENAEPPAATDGLFFRISMPDTTLLSNDQAAFEELSGQLGLLDVARLAVDGRVYAWQYDPTRTLGGWFLDGAMGFEPNDEFDTAEERDELLAAVGRLYNQLPEVGISSIRTSAHGRILDIVQDAREQWPPAHDYVSAHYIGRDSVGIELRGVLKFSIQGLSAAAEAVRFWCPSPQAHHEWNDARTQFFIVLDSLNAIEDQRVATAQAAAARRQEIQRAEAGERARLRTERERLLAAQRRQQDSISRAEEIQLRRIKSLLRGAPDHRVRAIFRYAQSNGVEVTSQQGLDTICAIWKSSDRAAVSPMVRVAMDGACELPS